MDYTYQDYSDGYYEKDSTSNTSNDELYEHFEDEGNLDTELEINISDEQFDENPEHSGIQVKTQKDNDDSPSENTNYKWTKYEEERVLYVYFKDLVDEKLLTADQEKEIAAQIKECKRRIEKIDDKLKKNQTITKDEITKLQAFRRGYEKKEEELKSKFIRANLRLVINIAKRHLGRGLALTDLVQEGNLGLIRAVEKFDHTKGFKFSTYGAWWIHQAVTRAIAEKTRTIKVPVYVLEQSSKVFKAKYMLQEELERKPLPKEIAERTKLSVEIVEAVLDGTDNVLSLDNPIKEDRSRTYMDFLPDSKSTGQEYNVDNRNMKDLLSELLTTLSAKEEEIVRMRYGFGNTTVHTLDEIGTKFGVTRERIRQIEKSALKKIASSEKGDKLKGYL
ncbi:MAG: sigma-70 family RNA polymerase sigma factor [Thermodesulfobacteriota bacterium]